ncbi:MAG: acetamidase/formamidase family protein [Anaerolineae bacterium]|nr:acetamidase/formamidase family protein [Caldilineales bacterium]MCX7853689.1 acetamidase/formamidase family protein [Caldilineales bacterium]MDW8268854.1 acetamidase/formamidase family protein [Anaerolineae bacterium]
MEHVLDKTKVHHKWDKNNPPAIVIEPGDTVHFETEEVSGGQVTPGCSADVFRHLNFDLLYPLAGPVYVNGAEPGDILEVEILHLRPLNWGWTGIIPGLGLLAEDFTEPYIRHFDLSNGYSAALREDIHIPLQPFCGVMGVATDDEGPLDVLPPTKGGGNIDTRHLNVGAKLYLPVYVPGALFSAGDCHAAQGDGEVCVTGIECPMQFSLRFRVIKGRTLPPWRYQFLTPPGSLQPRYDARGYFATTALGPDLMTNAKNAVRGLIDWLVATKGLSREDAYILCSLAADLKISQIVDAPNWGVSAYLALSVFTS